MPDHERRIQRAAKLLETLRELQAKTYEVTEELAKILNGDTAIGDQLKAFEAHYSELWHGRYGSQYAWQFAKDRVQIKRLIKTLGLVELCERAAIYLRDDDAFFARARHPFGLFVSSVNRFAVPVKAADGLELEAPTVADCRHRPKCRSDQEHTRRITEDLRA